MKKSIAFLLASLAATSSLLFHTQEAKATDCETKTPLYLSLYEDREEGTFRIRGNTPSLVEILQREGLTFNYKKQANKEFKKLCKGL